MALQQDNRLHRLRKDFNMLFSKLPRLFLRCIGLILVPVFAYAAPPNTSTTVYPAVPPNISSSSSKPMLMLVASKDHTLFSPMFTDFEDLDGDGVIDVTFKPDFKYYGYFDASKCYLYQNNQFEPDTNATVTSGKYVCGNTNQWSGNFLNWATMTRLDTVRKMLYGGQRFTDSATATVLQIARLSQDSHSFVKYYNGTDIRDYTPFTTASLTKTTGANANVYAGLSMCIRANANDIGVSSAPTIRMAKGNYRLWATLEGGKVCEWGLGYLGNKLKRYYGGTESYQGNGGINHESTLTVQATDGATYNSKGPDLNARIQVCVAGKLGQERCQAYGSSAALVYKPVGLLQDFGTTQSGATSAKTEFGLLTGSYDQNLKAGALRKNMGDLLDEIRPDTGQFCFSDASTTAGTGLCLTTALPDGRFYTNRGSINALDRVILYGKTNGNYDGSSSQLPSDLSNGTLSAWGNPVGEMVVQALQYYSGQSSTNPSTTTKDVGASVQVTDWTDPLSDTNTTRKSKYGTAICRPLNILALSSSALSFDGDDADTPFAALPNRSRGSLADFTDAIGAAEGINNTLRSVGSVTADTTAGKFGETCSGKTVTTLSKVSGVCPEAPAIGGTYKIAGAALYANTNRIRTVTSPPADLPAWALKVKTYAASLAGGVARVEVAIPNTNPKKYVYITPEGLWDNGSKTLPAAMLTFSAISSSSTHGAFVVTWNDSPFGGDYDMDIAGYLRYDILNPVPPSTKYRLKITTDIINEGASWTGVHGFSIMGTNGTDKRYLTHRHLSSDGRMNVSADYLCKGQYLVATDLSTVYPASAYPHATGNGTQACNATNARWQDQVVDRDSPVTLTFEMLGAESVTLRDPLWYAAKYGSFIPSNASSSTELPDTAAKWDSRRNDGKACGGSTGVSCQDGEPDGYFLARRPELLEQQLRATLEAIINTTNSAPAVSSSQLSSGSFKYIATFEPSQNSGSIIAYELNSAGNFSNTPKWEAGQKLTTVGPASRKVITNDGITGKAFGTTSSLSTDFIDALRGTGTGELTTAQGEELINYLRGERSKEKPAGIWRARSVNNIMGPIVNSSPWLQTRPSAQNLGTLAASYATFVTQQAARERLIWVGANDGMLHGFKAQGTDGGAPVLSYVPSPLVNRLSTMSRDSTSIISGMDGSPYTGDVLVGSGESATWKTYLFSSLGRGGRAFFSLDTTTPSNFTQENAASIFKWMFSSDDDTDLGYVIGDQQTHPISNQATPIVRMNNDKHAVLLPNGVGSGNGRAALFVLFVDGPASGGTWTAGTHYVKIPTDNLTGNGLVGVNWVDTNNDGKADALYGTDFKGRLWKFDVSSSTSSNWSSAFTSSGTSVPMFEAKNGTDALPVTTAPSISFPSFGGVMVAFGTGSAISTSDFPDASRTQRFISIYDRPSWTTPTRSLPNSDLSTLVPRTLKRASNGDVYISTGNIAFNQASHDGWYINFSALTSSSTLNNEMVLSSPQMRSGSLFFTTVKPTTASVNKCFADPEGTLYNIDPVSGTPKISLLGTVDITVNGSTVKVNKIGVPIGDQKITLPIKQSGSNANIKIVGQRTNIDLPEFMRLMRRQWREIPGMRAD